MRRVGWALGRRQHPEQQAWHSSLVIQQCSQSEFQSGTGAGFLPWLGIFSCLVLKQSQTGTTLTWGSNQMRGGVIGADAGVRLV